MHDKGTNPTWLRQVATALSRRYSVSVREGKNWCIDIEKRVLYYRPDHLLALDRDTALGILLHELGHLHFTKNNWQPTAKLWKDNDYREIVFNAVNAFEDVRINEKMSQSYQGSRTLIDSMNELLAGDGVEMIMDFHQKVKQGMPRSEATNMPHYHEVFYVAMCKLLGSNLFPNLHPEDYYDPEKMTLINEIVKDALGRDLKNLNSTKEVYDFVEEIVFPRIERYLPKPLPSAKQGVPKNTPQSENAEQGEEEATTGGKSPAPEQQGEEAPLETEQPTSIGSSNSESGDSPTAKPEPPQIPEPIQQPQPIFTEPKVQNIEKEVEKKIATAIKNGKLNPDKENATVFRQGQDFREIPKICKVEEHLEKSHDLSRQFSNRFEAIFRDNAYKREAINQRRGRLNNRILYKARLGKDRLFKRKLETTDKSYAVAFMLDMSSSMSREDVSHSYQAMLAFSETLQKLGIKYGIGFFSHFSEVGKDFDQKKMNPMRMNQAGANTHNGGTNPSTLLSTWLPASLEKQKADEKLVIALTDGAWNYGSYEALRQYVRKFPKTHFYLVGLKLHERLVQQILAEVPSTVHLINAENEQDIVKRYLEIAKKHLA